MHIDRLIPAITFHEQRFRNTHEGGLYMKVVRQAKSEGGALSAWTALQCRESVPWITLVWQTLVLNIEWGQP